MWMRLDEEKEEVIDERLDEEVQIIPNGEEEENECCHQTVQPETELEKSDPNSVCGVQEIRVMDHQQDEQELVCAEDEDMADYDFVVVKQWTLRTCWHSRYTSVCLYIILALILVASLLALLIVVSMVTVPFQRASGFVKSTCEVVSAHQHSSPSICSCGKGCDSHYPCLTVAVQYTDHTGTIQNASMYENEIILRKRVSIEFKENE